MSIVKRAIKKIDFFLMRNSGHNPYNDMFHRDMWDYYSGNVVPINDVVRKEGKKLTFKERYGSPGIVSSDMSELELKVAGCVTANVPDYTGGGVSMTAGHLACQGGLRGHSVGDVFPYVPYFKGKYGEQVWVHCPSGEQLGPFVTQEQMYDALEFLEVYREHKNNQGV